MHRCVRCGEGVAVLFAVRILLALSFSRRASGVGSHPPSSPIGFPSILILSAPCQVQRALIETLPYRSQDRYLPPARSHVGGLLSRGCPALVLTGDAAG